ncbi:MAG: M23 family metallopeptidase [Gammaproteobacteria bacterium]|nr:M23 family metallopeptidase [Gammaproteobacteria bacterium]MCF6230040.1 M23 family metallopeptidase [Gammaproteobacteria bacterium]
MDIILLTKGLRQKGSLSLRRWHVVSLGLLAFLMVPLVALYGGYLLGQGESVSTLHPIQLEWQQGQQQQQLALAEEKQKAQENLNVLAIKVGQLQAHIMRIDALGERLTEMAKIDGDEFDFSVAPAQGGPERGAMMRDTTVDDFIRSLDALSLKLEHRSQQMNVLEGLLMSRSLQGEVSPQGRPVIKGWLSSHFGERTDPFTGKLAQHNGVDFAGREGSHVISVAAGVVTAAEKRYGYGNLVEVNHGNGYVTRYGHNKSLQVSVGQVVKKGEVLALMGSTGRSTGPHVHFEVLQNGNPVDPAKYIYTARK